MRPSQMLAWLGLLLLALTLQASAQQSDYEITQQFEERYGAIRDRLDHAATTTQLDSLRRQIDALQADFKEHAELLDKAFYPQTFESRIAQLRQMHTVANNRTSLILAQGGRIVELESQLGILSGKLDSLSTERNKMFGELEESRKSVASLRDAVKRLTANIQAHERLVFSMLDSIFLPYGRDLAQATDVQKEALENRLERANVVTRVYDIAADNLRFLEATQLQGKDYINLIEQYQQFRNRWNGLSGSISAVAQASERRATSAPGKGPKTAPAVTQAKSAQVDSLLAEWNRRLQSNFWAGIEKEFTEKGVTIPHFTDAASFSTSVRSYVASLRDSGQDPSPFVDEVWKGRIDKEWRDALSKDAMLGKAEYASLDKLVSELDQKKVDLKLILYIVGVLVIVGLAWWLLSRRPKRPVEEPPAS